MVAVGLMALMFMTQTYKFMQFNKTSEVVIDANVQSVTKVCHDTIINAIAQYQHEHHHV